MLALAACKSSSRESAAASSSPAAAPGEPSGTPREIYEAQLVALTPLETAALDAVRAHTGAGYTDDAALLAALRDTALPQYRRYLDGLTAIVAPGDLVKFHDRLTDLARAELSALERLEAAVARGDPTLILVVNQDQQRIAAEMDALARDFPAAPAP